MCHTGSSMCECIVPSAIKEMMCHAQDLCSSWQNLLSSGKLRPCSRRAIHAAMYIG